MPLQIVATDSIPSQSLTFSASGLPPGLSISTTGLITGTPNATGTYNPVITATDSLGVSGSVSFTWFITGGGGNVVTVTNPGNQSGRVRNNVNLQITATDSDHTQTLTFSATNLPTGTSISSSGLITGTLNATGTFNTTVNAIDTTGARGTTAFTWTVTSTAPVPGFVGCTVPPSAFRTGCYDVGQTQSQADSGFVSVVGRPTGSTHLLATKKFWGTSSFDVNFNDLVNYKSFGTRVIMCLQPVMFTGLPGIDPATGRGTNFTNSSGLTSTQQQQAQNDVSALASFLSALRTTTGLRLTSQQARIVLWQEPANANKHISATDYGNMLRTYGPTVNSSLAADGLPYPLVMNVNYVGGGPVSNATDYANAGLGLRGFTPTGCTFLGIAMDFYTTSYYRITSTNPFAVVVRSTFTTTDANGDSISGIADANNLAFGVHEIGCNPSVFDPSGPPYPNCTAYMNYIKSFMSARVAAGKTNLDVMYWDGNCSATGAGQESSPIGLDTTVSSPDFRIALYQSIFDAISGN